MRRTKHACKSKQGRTAIEKRLTEAMSHKKPPIGTELAQHLAEWGQWLGNRDSSCRSSDWHVNFQVGDRRTCRRVQAMGRAKKTDKIKGALAAIQKVYEFYWPRNLAGHLFGQLWGWLQIELQKPGIPKALNVLEQMEALQKHTKERGNA